MAKLVFEGSTHADLVRQVREWLTDVEGSDVLEGTVVVDSPVDAAIIDGGTTDDRGDALWELLRAVRKIAPGVVEDEAQLLALLARLSGMGSSGRAGSDAGASVSSMVQWLVETAQKANTGASRNDDDAPRTDSEDDDSGDW